MKHTKLMLSIVMIFVGLIIPINIRFEISMVLVGMFLASMFYEQDFWFGDGTKKATTHRHE